MSRILQLILALWLPAVASAELVTATISITNNPVGNTNTITVNGVTRTWTNDVSGSVSTLISETNTTAWAATNLINHFTRYPLNVSSFLSYGSETSVVIRSIFPLTVTSAGGWASVDYTTNATTPAVHPTMPITTHATTNRTNIATWLAEAGAYSTQPLLMHWTLLSQVAGLTNNNAFTGTNSLSDGGWNRPRLTNVTALSGVATALTNGYWTNAVLDSPTTTNLVNYGSSIRSPGSGSNSQQFGGSSATGTSATSVGVGAVATGTSSSAFGQLSSAGANFATAIGSGAEVTATNGTAVGQNTLVSGAKGIAVGQLSSVTHSNSFAIGQLSASTAADQGVIGSTAHTVLIPGVLQAGTLTNTTHTGTNHFHGAISFNRRTDSSQPTGHNIVTNNFADNLVWLTAPSGTCTNVGFTDGWDGRVIRYVKYNGGFAMGIANESGLASAERRVLTGTGADVTITNSPGWFDLMYDATLSRWILTGHSQ